MTAPINVSETKTRGYQFGTIKGVFIPSILTILGVIMFLRFGWVLGNVGLFKTLIIVTLATSITFLTGLSISAMATNMKVGGGGAYFIISRSLGLEAGAAIGLPLYFAQAVGISFYISGFSEALNAVFPFLPLRLIGIITLIILTALAYFSASLALKSQFIIFAVIILALISFFAGFEQIPAVSAEAIVPKTKSFWVVFAVFFPAVTGIEAGLSMSGDLKDPSKSLPRGTLSAIVSSYLVYIAIPIFLYIIVKDRDLLLTNSFVMKDISRWPLLILLGVWGATLSSAMGSLLGAPRTMQALAKDKVVPAIVGRGYGQGNDPRIATGITFFVALIGIVLGDLNLIAPVLSMFFLTSYGLLNVSASLENLIGSPSWRPKFRVHWILSFIGGFSCFAVMFMINPGATFMAILIALVVFSLMKRRRIKSYWGDLKRGILMLLAQYAVTKLADKQVDKRTWRPNMLALSGSPTARWHLIEMADNITHGKGFLTLVTILPENEMTLERIETGRDTVRQYLKEKGISALVSIHLADSYIEGAKEIVKTFGFGPLMPNTFIMGETEKEENFLEYAKLIRLINKRQRNLLIFRKGDIQSIEEKENTRIEIWWGLQKQNAGLMLAIAYLLKQDPEWEDCPLVLKTIVNTEEEIVEAEKRLNEFLETARIEGSSEVIIKKDTDVFHLMQESTVGASLVFIGMREPGPEETDQEYSIYYDNLIEKTKYFPPTMITLASEDIEFYKMFVSK
ncbi:MAG: amino acid permease [Pseudomonadota bacterium]